MSFGVFGGVADVEDLRAGVAHGEDSVELDGVEDLLEGFLERRALAGVEDGVVGEVGGGVGLVGRYDMDEFFLRHGLKGVVEATLVAEGGYGV